VTGPWASAQTTVQPAQPWVESEAHHNKPKLKKKKEK